MDSSREEAVNFVMCKSCIQHQDQLLEDGDGSQVICDHFPISREEGEEDEVVVDAAVPVAVVDTTESLPYASAPTTTRKRKFISSFDFEDKADDSTKLRLSSIINWTQLYLDAVYQHEAC